jgi:hypothetical protein
VQNFVFFERAPHLGSQLALGFVLALDRRERPALAHDSSTFQRREEIRFLFAMMKSIGELVDELDELGERCGGNRVSPLKPDADSVERAQGSLNYAMFMLEGM